ncbi:MAG: hypothetical protein DYG89_16910 [Caldilinea sp. CFX5]|nr:hypothetical protein [Caldilinea sp. CFX5]
MQHHRYRLFLFLSLLFGIGSGLTGLFIDPITLLAQNRPWLVPIYQLQGNGLVSPYAEKWVDSYGLVTGVLRDGFYLQDPVGDDDPATSDGIFVYTNKRPTVTPGECVVVTRAYVTEFYEKTELSRLKSITPSDRCPSQTVQAASIPLPHLGMTPSITYEAYEGMLVAMTNLTGTVQGPTKHFADGDRELALLPTTLQAYIPGGRVFQADSAALNALVYLTNELGASLPELPWGAPLVVGAATPEGRTATAILDYNFGKYQLHLLPATPVEPLLADPTVERQPEEGRPTAPDEFGLCIFNVYGLGRGSEQRPDAREYQQHLAKRARAIAETLHGCTIIGLQETGTPADAQNLADFLAELYQLDYEATALAGPNTQSREFPLTNSLLTRRDQVQVLAAAAPQGCSPKDYAVPAGAGDCPRGQYALFDRPPLVVDLRVTGAWGEPITITVVNNHWKSKAGDETVNAVRRADQARHVATLVQAKLATDPNALVTVLGDLNDYYPSTPVEVLRTGVQPPLVHLYDYLPPLDRYTYIFNGGSQVLDHLLVTPALAALVTLVDPIHSNADFPAGGQTQLQTLAHASDHDPVQVVLRPEGAAILGGSLRYADIHVQLVDQNGGVVTQTTTDANGDFRLWQLPIGAYTLNLTPPPAVTMEPQTMPIELGRGYQRLPTPALAQRTVTIGVALALSAAHLAPTAPRE